MGLSRKVVRIELTSRTAGPDDRVALPGMPLWDVSWTERDRLGRERTWTAPHITEGAARRMVTNLLDERAPGLTDEAVYRPDVMRRTHPLPTRNCRKSQSLASTTGQPRG